MKLPNKVNYAWERVKTYSLVWFFTYVAVCVLYTTGTLIGVFTNTQVLVREVQYIKQVEALSPLGE